MNDVPNRKRRYSRPYDQRFDQQAERKCESMVDIGDVLRKRRKEQRYTQEEMARICGYSPRLIGEIERGRGTVGVDKVIKYAHWLGVDLFTKIRGK